jgi:hypothetical protein
MPSKEAGESGKEKPHRPSYLDARRYQDPQQAALAYLKSQEAIWRDRGRANLSVYRLMIGPELQMHVVVLGDTPNTKLFE